MAYIDHTKAITNAAQLKNALTSRGDIPLSSRKPVIIAEKDSPDRAKAKSTARTRPSISGCEYVYYSCRKDLLMR